MSEKVVFLAFKNDKMEPDTRDFLACKHCRNKTFTMIYQGTQKFPLIQCAACGDHLGHVGWAGSEDTDEPSSPSPTTGSTEP